MRIYIAHVMAVIPKGERNCHVPRHLNDPRCGIRVRKSSAVRAGIDVQNAPAQTNFFERGARRRTDGRSVHIAITHAEFSNQIEMPDDLWFTAKHHVGHALVIRTRKSFEAAKSI